MSSSSNALLAVSGLKTYFPSGGRWFGRREWIRAVDGVDLEVERGHVLAVVGESGSGKTTLGRSILRLQEPIAGSIRFDDVDVLSVRGADLRALRRRMQIVFQNPYASLSPRMHIKQILAEPLRLHRIVSEDHLEERVVQLLAKVRLEPYFMYRYPHEMSGGQRQRIAIARALSLEPEFIVADEPVSALDVSVQATILNILLDLQRSDGIALLFISHDLAVVERIADRVAVMYRGKIIEEAATDAVVGAPMHPYTKALLAAVPDLRPTGRRLSPATHELPEDLPSAGCPFAPRCPEVRDVCWRVAPHLERKAEGHAVSCHLY